MKRLQTYHTQGITVTFDPKLCIHSRVCIQTLPAVFDVSRSRWIAPGLAEAIEVATAIDHCPSGALKYVLERNESTRVVEQSGEASTITIQASKDGPLLVRGAINLIDDNGMKLSCSGKTALCRCGASGNQPFCDGSHTRVGFKSKVGPVS